MKTIRYHPDDVIFLQGTAPDRLYLVKSGTVQLTSQIDVTTYRRIPTVRIPLIHSVGQHNMGNADQHQDHRVQG